MMARSRTHRKRHCGHFHLQALRGSVATLLGFSLQCMDCWTFLEGPWTLAMIDRDPERLIEAQEGWYLGKMVWAPEEEPTRVSNELPNEFTDPLGW